MLISYILGKIQMLNYLYVNNVEMEEMRYKSSAVKEITTSNRIKIAQPFILI